MNDPNRLTHAKRQERRKKMAEAVHAGETIPHVATRFGVTVELVQRACYQHGVPYRDRRTASVIAGREIGNSKAALPA